MKFNRFARLATLSVAMAFAWTAQAAPKPPEVPTLVTPCTTDSVSITHAVQSKLGIPPVLLPAPIDSTSCYGVMSGNEGPLEGANPNLGYLEDGLLNGGKFKDVQYMPPYEFLTMVGGDVPQDLDNDGEADDPGWVFLGGMQGFDGELDYAQSFNGDSTLNMADVIKFTMSSADGTSGTWALDVVANVKEVLEAAGIFNRSHFDHLALVIKSGNDQSGGGWAVYDFNFNLLAGFDLDEPHRMQGLWNTDDFSGHAISHIGLWARDPVSTDRQIPEPGTFVLIGLGLLAAGWARQRRH